MQVYFKNDPTKPCNTYYITEGKRYNLITIDSYNYIKDDEGEELYIHLKGCAHLCGGNWIKEEN